MLAAGMNADLTILDQDIAAGCNDSPIPESSRSIAAMSRGLLRRGLGCGAETHH